MEKARGWMAAVGVLNVFVAFALAAGTDKNSVIAAESGTNDNSAVAAEWEQIALSRQGKAVSLTREAAQIQKMAAKLRTKDFLSQNERQSNYRRASDAEMKAGMLHETAIMNFGKEVLNWRRAVEAYALVPDQASGDKALSRIKKSDLKARKSMKSAIKAYSLAANGYSEENGAMPKKEKIAMVSEARVRLQLQKSR